MTFDHGTTRIHLADLDREIERLRIERGLGRDHRPRVIDRARRGAGRALIAAGIALAGRDGALRTHRV